MQTPLFGRAFEYQPALFDPIAEMHAKLFPQPPFTLLARTEATFASAAPLGGRGNHFPHLPRHSGIIHEFAMRQSSSLSMR